MYAVIRTGGKQYRVAPGDVVRVEKLPGAHDNDRINFEVLAVSPDNEGLRGPRNTTVVGQVMEHGRHDKVLVFHFKRKKQYKKMYGHRQPFTAVRISEITVDGERYAAPELPAKAEKKPKAKPPAEVEAAPEHEEHKKKAAKKPAHEKHAGHAPEAHAAHKKAPAKKAAPKKGTASKGKKKK